MDTYAKLTPWQKTQVARHPDRPHCLDYVKALIEDFTPLAGDRYFAEDAAIMGGLGRFRGRPVVVIGNEKGSDTESRIQHNFGMARPEGYRKAVRLMELADKFGLPVVTLIDTAGAYPGIGAEERGQAEAIARSTDRCLSLGVPMVAVVIGEGGSGGAVAIASANRVLMLEHAIYTVASPEAAASILWRDSARAIDAATSMKITAQDLKSARRHRRDHHRAGRRRPPRPRDDVQARPAMPSPRPGNSRARARKQSAASATRSSSRSAAISDVGVVRPRGARPRVDWRQPIRALKTAGSAATSRLQR